jgi:NAD(P)-dependent dehydrogenase (short-subunit alcohol dehydrogenase family)
MMYSVFERGFPWLTGNEVGLGVCDEDSWEAVVQLIEKACSHLDVVVNCAPFTFEVTGRSDRTTWAGRAGKHVQSVQATMAACMPLLGKSGRGCLINVIAQPHPDQLDTWESWPARAAMLAMTKLGAVTGTDDQTRVNAVSVDNWGSLKTSGQLDAVDLSHCVPEAATADAPTAIALAAGFLASQGVEGFNGVDLLVKPNQRQPLKQ